MDYEAFSRQNQKDLMLDENILGLVEKYCKLVSKPQFSEQDSDQLQKLLDIAIENSRLDFWIHEADHFMDHELGLTNGTTIFPVETENLRLELLKRLDECSKKYNVVQDWNDTAEIVEEIQDFVQEGNEKCREVQENLRLRGLYSGVIDGRVGPLTQEAVKKFQKDNNLQADGKIDSETCTALTSKSI